MSGSEFSINDYLSDDAQKQIVSGATNGALFLMRGAVKSTVDFIFGGLRKKNISPEDVQEKATKDLAYLGHITRITATASREQVREKLDAWVEIWFAIHTGALNDLGNIERYTKLLEDCVVQDLIALGSIYGALGDHGEGSIVNPENIKGLTEEQANLSIQRLGSLGLLNQNFDKTGYWGSRDNGPNLSGLYYTRNSLGKNFLTYAGQIQRNQPELVNA